MRSGGILVSFLSLASLSTKHKMPRLCCATDSRQSHIFSNTAGYGMVSEWPSGHEKSSV